MVARLFYNHTFIKNILGIVYYQVSINSIKINFLVEIGLIAIMLLYKFTFISDLNLIPMFPANVKTHFTVCATVFLKTLV